MNLLRPPSGRSLRIAYGRLFHEANAFSPVRTTLEDFERMHLLSGDTLAKATGLRGVELKSFMPHAELTGFRLAARVAGNVTCIPLTSALAVPGGPLTRVCFDTLVERILGDLDAALPVDGVYLALHGSMQVDGLDGAPEAHLLARVRALVGDNVKIAVSYDLHANLSEGLIVPTDVLVAYRSNPHWDLCPTGYRAGARLIATLRGTITPVHAWRKLPMTLGGGMNIDFLAPLRPLFRWMRALEDDPRVVSASLFMVHPYTDAERIGWSVHVSTNGDTALAESLADALADRAWAMHAEAIPSMLTVDEAIAAARRSPWRRLGPVTFIDVDDIVGAGAPGGNTHIVEALTRTGSDLIAYVPVHDPALVDALWSAADNSTHNVVLRGTEGYEMPAVPLRAHLVAHATTDFGRMLRLDVGSIHVVVCDRAPLPIHPSFWKSVGLNARRADVIVQKNFFHYRMFYATVSFDHIPVVSDGATNLRRVRDRDYDVPMAPRSHVASWREYDPVLRARRSRNDVT